MSSEIDSNAQNNTRGGAPDSTTTSAVSHPTPPPAPAILVSRTGFEPHHHAYGNYPAPPYYHRPPSHPCQPTQSEAQVHHHPGQANAHIQMAEANILSSMKKAPLATIVDNPAEDDEGGEEEFGKLSGRKLDSSFAEGSAIRSGNSNIISQHRAPTPLLLSPDSSTDGSATRKARSNNKIDASKDGRSLIDAKVDSSEKATSSAFGANKRGISDALGEPKEGSDAGDAPPSSKLSELDAMTCHNIEVFQATKEDADAFNSAEAVQLFGTSTAKHVVSGHVGFRCVHCFAGEDMGPTATVHSCPSVVYPASVGTISTALRHMRDHFDSCEAMSQASKNAFADARREQEEQDAGLGRSSCQKKGGGKNGPDERRRIAFLDFCVDFCQRKDIVNIQPQRSGLKYRLPVAPSSSVAVGDAATGISTAGMPRREGLVPATNVMGAKHDDKSLTPTSIPATITAIPQNAGNSSAFIANFPFFSDGYGAWICRFCCSVPYPYRGAGSVWNAPNQAPPTREFVDQHMKLCKGGAPPPPQMVVGRAPSTPHTPQMPPLPGNTTEANSETMRTTQLATPRQQSSGPRASPAAGAISTHQPYYRMSPQVLRSPHMPPRGVPPHPYHPNPYARPLPAQPFAGRPPMAPAAAMGKKPQRRAARAPPPTQKELKLPPGVDGSGSDKSIHAAITYLVQEESSRCLPPPKDPQIELVGSEDKLLLTDYFSHLMRQLRLVRFSEADRKTRGGKREKVVLGYGGLECVHCIGQPGARKFFWSNVDRLSNSFAEIPAHILKCKYCAPEVKAALLELKTCHAKQMQSLPRGSQKVYLRRVWRRIHDGDPSLSSRGPGGASLMPTLLPSRTGGGGGGGGAETAIGIGTATAAAPRSYPTAGDAGTNSSKNTIIPMSTSITTSPKVGAGASVQGNNGDDSPSSMERSATKSLAALRKIPSKRSSTSMSQNGTDQVSNPNPTVIIGPHTRLIGNPNAFVDATPSCGTCKDGAEALAACAAAQSTGEYQSHPIVMLAIQEDQEWLSDHDCFVRRNLEVFIAGEKDVLTAKADRKLGVTVAVGQVGIRCLHCAVAVSRYSDGRRGARGSAVQFPHSISTIYECVKELHRNHLENGCPHLPSDVRLKILELKGSMASSLSSVLRRYYVMAAKALGMVDCGKEGIRARGVSVPLGSSAEHEYATVADRASSALAGPSVNTEDLRTRAAKAIGAATVASRQNARAVGAAVAVKTVETTPKKNELSDAEPGKPRAGETNVIRSTIADCDTSVKRSEQATCSGAVPETQTRDEAPSGVAATAAAPRHPTAAPFGALVHGYAPSMTSAPPSHYGYHHHLHHYGGAYGAPHGSAYGGPPITPLESRKRKAPLKAAQNVDEERPSSTRKKTRRM